jgi:hypothetical protein
VTQSSKRSDRTDSAEIDRLAAAVERLAEEVRVLRDALDDFGADFRWAARNDKLGGPMFVLTSMPSDPAAPDWAERLNRLTASDVPAHNSPVQPRRQAALW